MANWDLIASQSLTSDTATVTFASIPSTYDDLVVKGTVKTNNTSIYTQAALTFNNSTSAQYSRIALYIDGGPAVLSATDESNQRFAIINPSNSGHTSSFSTFELWINRYKNTSYHKMSRTFWTRLPNDGSQGLMGNYQGIWKNNGAISEIDIFDPTSTASWLSGSTFYLYGVSYS